MYLVAIAWMYVVLMMAAAEAVAPNGSVLGAVFTLLLYGVLPVALVMYLMATPARRRARKAAEADPAPPDPTLHPEGETSAAAPDGGRHAPGGAVAAKREEP